MKYWVLLLPLCVCIHAYETIIDVLSRHSEFSTLIGHLQRQRLVVFVNQLDSATLFAPNNEAFRQLKDIEITRERLLYHLIPEYLPTQLIHPGQLLESCYIRPGLLETNYTGQKLKITEWVQTLKVNNVSLSRPDIYVNAKTTIHAVDQVLSPPKMASEVVKEHDERLYHLIRQAQLIHLIDSHHTFTLFVSSRYLMDKFNSIERQYLTSHEGFQDLNLILKYSIVSRPIYLDTHPVGDTSYTTESGEQIHLKVDMNRRMTVNHIPVLHRDVVAANGIVHYLDDTLSSNAFVFTTRKCLIGLNATKFVSLVDEQGLGHYLDDHSHHLTILAPTNEAMDEDAIPNNLKKQWLSYHFIEGAYEPHTLSDQMVLKTKYSSPYLRDAQRLLIQTTNQSVFFGPRSKMIGSTYRIQENIIYRITNPLSLPKDLFTSLVVDLDYTLFLATLYKSGLVQTLNSAEGITVFAPTNTAFEELGLVTRYLLHSEGKSDLRTVLQYHVTPSLLYYQDLSSMKTISLTNESIYLHQGPHQIRMGLHANASSAKNARVEPTDLLLSNGVVHPISRLQIPPSAHITHQKLLKSMSAYLMNDMLDRTRVLDGLDLDDVYLLVPTDQAFSALESVWNDTATLTKIAKLHVLPKRRPQTEEFETLLADENTIMMGQGMVKVKGQPVGVHAHILGMGSVRRGGVIEIDAVLFPVEKKDGGVWGTLFVVFLWLSIWVVGSTGGSVLYKMYKRSKDGYETIEIERQESQ
ncbi:FAS1 domain-containing protein [Pilobolus umbonatus]|nr:FAS1 domain-containing protein [Pilobolus umbonatus]